MDKYSSPVQKLTMDQWSGHDIIPCHQMLSARAPPNLTKHLYANFCAKVKITSFSRVFSEICFRVSSAINAEQN